MRFGYLTLMSMEGVTSEKHKCLCDCGNITYVPLSALKSGNTRSCGCLQKETASKLFFKHGLKGTTEYTSWILMRDRCNNPNNKTYSYYGGRGITVCERWDDFLLFLEDVGKKPSKSHTIDRIDSNDNYHPHNCKWSTKKEQVRNRSNTKKLIMNGVTKPLAEWAEIYGIPYHNLNRRIWEGWSVERALTTKVRS